MNKSFACILVVLALALVMWIMAIAMCVKTEQRLQERERSEEIKKDLEDVGTM